MGLLAASSLQLKSQSLLPGPQDGSVTGYEPSLPPLPPNLYRRVHGYEDEERAACELVQDRLVQDPGENESLTPSFSDIIDQFRDSREGKGAGFRGFGRGVQDELLEAVVLDETLCGDFFARAEAYEGASETGMGLGGSEVSVPPQRPMSMAAAEEGSGVERADRQSGDQDAEREEGEKEEGLQQQQRPVELLDRASEKPGHRHAASQPAPARLTMLDHTAHSASTHPSTSPSLSQLRKTRPWVIATLKSLPAIDRACNSPLHTSFPRTPSPLGIVPQRLLPKLQRFSE